MTKASIITIGDELLIGQVIDTNSAWMAQELNKIGISVLRRVAVGDRWDEIWSALDEESSKADIILITGGLGPTADDITKPLLCEYFNGTLISNQEALDHITHLFKNIYKRPLTDRNRKQAEVPDTCTILINKIGTAPGMWFEKDGKVIVSMPGVPNEMKGLMIDQVLPALKKQFELPFINHKTLITFGIGESALADLIASFENNLPAHIKLAYLPNYGIVRLRLSSSGFNKDVIKSEMESLFSELKSLVSSYLIFDEDASMEKIVATRLLKIGASVATAESCTGGYIAHLFTSIPGSSAFFKGSIIAYSNEIKMNELNVPSNCITQNGAVSEAVVLEMAKGLISKLKTDYVIAVSGVMGPDGGSQEKPVGTVWVAVGNHTEIEAKCFHFRFDRQKNIQLTAMNALNFLRQFIDKSSSK